MSLVKSGRQPVQDEFTNLLVSDSRKQQLRWKRDGKCIRCGSPRVEASNSLCLKHWQIIEDIKQQKREAREKTKQEKYYSRKQAIAEGASYLREQENKNLTIKLPTIKPYHWRPTK